MSDYKINNKVEILRAICFDKTDYEEIKNFGDYFTDDEIDFMIEFKKIYELGYNQLYKFIDKLDQDGSKLDETSIEYYVEIIKAGPLATFAEDYVTKNDKKYFGKYPDSLGSNGNQSITMTSNPYYGDEFPLGVSVDLYNKLPLVSQVTLPSAIKITEEVFKENMYCAVVMDNTLPLADKNPQGRYKEEKEWAKKSNGSLGVKDFDYLQAVKDAAPQIFEKVKTSLGEENNRLFEYKKTTNPFSSEDNLSIGGKYKVVREVGPDVEEEYDLSGELYDSDKRRESTLKIDATVVDKKYLLNSNDGQLGH